MPTDGPVEESQVDADAESAPGSFYDPLPPQAGQSATEVVSGFLEAMKATPISTSVARQFLTSAAQEAWAPEQRILTYADLDLPAERGLVDGERAVSAALSGVNQYDDRGAWVRTGGGKQLDFVLTAEEGEWRISEAPDALVVPASWFDDWYQRVSLYYFDPAAQILVPEPVFVPEGDQFASSLVRGLLTPPTGRAARVVRTFFPSGTTPGLSVPIKSGVAQVSLTGDGDAVAAETERRMLAQLAWTLSQEDRIGAVELRIGDRTIRLPGGATQVPLDIGAEYDPTGANATGDLFALQDGLLVRGALGSMLETAGPLGQADLGARAVGVSLPGTTVAAVTGGGTSVLMAPVDAADGPAVEVEIDAVDVLPPVWDHRDRVWLVDRAGGRARVHLVTDGVPRGVAVPGVTGRDVAGVLVSRDGSRLVALVRGRSGDEVVASRVQQDENGRVLRVLRARRLALPAEGTGRIRDLAWRTPTTVSVLTAFPGDISEVRTISVDGAPGEIETVGSTRRRGRTSSLVSSPLGGNVYAVGGRTITDLTQPERDLPDLPAGLRGLTYTG
jgi:hypothetical protein